MKELMITFSLLLMICSSVAADLNGSIEYIGDIRIMNLWGSWSEMGYAQGYLMGPDIKEIFEDYFIEMAGGVSAYESARSFVELYFDIPPEFQQYASGLIIGASDTISIYSEILGRDMDALDIYTTSSTPDVAALKGFRSVLCSSVSSWGPATAGDPELEGSPAISRNLDYYVDTNGTILEKTILITFDPDDGQEWVSFGYPGFLGCLSGMNSSGICATLNMGNYQGTVQYSEPFVPICMALALGLSDPDFNGSGACDVEDMKEALIEWNRANSYDIHVVADRDLGAEDSASVVVEVSNRDGYAFRYAYHEPQIAPCRMILTNHHRVLRNPVYCERYANLLDSLTTNPDVTLSRLWGFLGAVGWPATPGLGGTLQSMIFIPEQLRMGLAFASIYTPSYEKEPQWIDWDDIFPNHYPQGIEDDVFQGEFISVAPNPSAGFLTVNFDGTIESIGVYDISGRKLDVSFTEESDYSFSADLSHLPEGIYRITAHRNGITFSEDVVIIR